MPENLVQNLCAGRLTDPQKNCAKDVCGGIKKCAEILHCGCTYTVLADTGGGCFRECVCTNCVCNLLMKLAFFNETKLYGQNLSSRLHYGLHFQRADGQETSSKATFRR